MYKTSDHACMIKFFIDPLEIRLLMLETQSYKQLIICMHNTTVDTEHKVILINSQSLALAFCFFNSSHLPVKGEGDWQRP